MKKDSSSNMRIYKKQKEREIYAHSCEHQQYLITIGSIKRGWCEGCTS